MVRRSSGGEALGDQTLPLSRLIRVAVGVLALALGFSVTFQLARPLPRLHPVTLLSQTEHLGTPIAIPWPPTGAAAMVVPGLGSLGSSGPATPRPMASTAKIMTALLVLEDKPLDLSQPGPVIRVTQADAANYAREVRLNESVVPVVVGEQLSEYQLLEGLLLPSASNFADMLAAWDAGSLPAFIDKMNQRARELGMAQTHYVDASGFSPQTVSVPTDLITVAQAAMANPVFEQIVAQPQASLPVAGGIRNLDVLLGRDGVVGIKTGHTDQAGGCFVFAADLKVNDQPVRLYGAVMGQPGALPGAFAATSSLLHAVASGLHAQVLVRRGEIAGYYQAPWGARTDATAAETVSMVVYDGILVRRSIQLHDVGAPVASGSWVGLLSLQVGEQTRQTRLLIGQPIAEPDLLWRLTRPL